MSIISEIGKLGLEGLMERANIVFTNGYRFKGVIDEIRFSESVKAICSCVIKFNYQLNFITQDNYTWNESIRREYSVKSIATSDLDQEFSRLCRESFILFDKPNSEPMLFTLIKNADDLDDEFIISQSCNHIYVDARSAEVIFNNIINHYNALCLQDTTAANDIVLKTQALRTLESTIVIEECFNNNPHADHDNNVGKIVNYPINDFGKHVIPMNTLDEVLIHYREKARAPLVQYFNIESMINHCRKKQPDISKNSIVCAVIAKAIYNINVQEKGVKTNHIISFKMVSDILSTDLRKKYSGNYIAFVPVCVNGEKNLEEMAKDINDWVVDLKRTGLNTSVFSLTEDAIRDALVGTADDPLSFVVTNWNNYSFTDTKDFLINCQSIRHQSGVNINPKDALGAALVNRPVLVINFSPCGELCISQFPSLSSQTINENLSEHLSAIFLSKEISL